MIGIIYSVGSTAPAVSIVLAPGEDAWWYSRPVSSTVEVGLREAEAEAKCVQYQYCRRV